jgi:hypothetical protein
MSAFGAKAEIIPSRCNVRYYPKRHDFLDCSACGDLVRDRSPGLWRGRGAYPQILKTVCDASKAAAEVASGCDLCGSAHFFHLSN